MCFLDFPLHVDTLHTPQPPTSQKCWNESMSMAVQCGLSSCSQDQGSHFSGLTKFPDYSSISPPPNFPVFFSLLKTILANNTQFI